MFFMLWRDLIAKYGYYIVKYVLKGLWIKECKIKKNILFLFIFFVSIRRWDTQVERCGDHQKMLQTVWDRIQRESEPNHIWNPLPAMGRTISTRTWVHTRKLSMQVWNNITFKYSKSVRVNSSKWFKSCIFNYKNNIM